jgi:long-chain-acyl-CoA dehydrogenase
VVSSPQYHAVVTQRTLLWVHPCSAATCVLSLMQVAKTNPDKGAHGISLFLVEQGMPGFSKGKKLKKMGLKAQDTSELFFEDVRLPASALLGKENAGFYYLMNELPQERLLIAVTCHCYPSSARPSSSRVYACVCSPWAWLLQSQCLSTRAGMSRSARRSASRWKRCRCLRTLPQLDGRRFQRFVTLFLYVPQTIRHKMAEIKTELAVGRAFVDQCVKLHNEKNLDSATASMCKYWITDLQCKTMDRCLQLFGGWGYMLEYPVCRAFMDARVQPIYGGTNEVRNLC